MNRTNTARHVMGGDTSGTHAFLQMPGWAVELKLYLPWRIYNGEQPEIPAVTAKKYIERFERLQPKKRK